MHRNRPSSRKFDDGNGQVYLETSTRAPRSQDRYWTELSELEAAEFEIEIGLKGSRERLLRVKEYAKYIKKQDRTWPESGTRRLTDIALTVTVKHIKQLQPCMLEDIKSDRVLLALWREINRNCLTNFVTWQAFSRLLCHRRDPETGEILPCTMVTLDLFRYGNHIRSPALPLLDYLTPLITPSFDFITILSIKPNVPLVHLIQLKKLKNLGVLHLHNNEADGISHSNVTDRLLRAWSEAVVTEGAFPVLRVLNIWGHPDITIRSLEYVSKFPALGFFDIRQSVNLGTPGDIESQARKHEWTAKITKNNLDDEHARLMALWKTRNGCKFPGGERLLLRSFKERKAWDEHRVERLAEQNSEESVPNDEANLPLFQEHQNSFKDPKNQWLYMGQPVDEYWQLNLHPLFTLIGQMRGDLDLATAGVTFDASRQLSVEGWPIPPIPIVSLHMGSESSYDRPLPSPSPSRPDVSFTRLHPRQAPEASDANTQESSSKESSDHKLSTEARELSQMRTKSNKRPDSKTVRLSKRMKLDSVLDAFSSKGKGGTGQ